MKGKILIGLLVLALGLLLLLGGCDSCGDDFCPIPSRAQGAAALCGSLLE
ncbi:MAG: hypothetical protein NUW06_04795 [Candidatus Acetothermia bacterium]|jgi:hypothetical protein|nr:hypothetical protein [Candidatus Acetothermia bacterium]MDH7505223.1 hypothetical protein [Candidatus Acetothermia bacterium]